MTQDVIAVERPRREAAIIQDPIPLFDSQKFEMMQRVATAMARGSLVPEALTHVKPKGANEPVPLPYETVLANCFLVVNQAVRWNMDPFAIAQCVSVVHGKLCYEGKLVAAVLDAKLGVRLRYEWNDKTGDSMAIKVSGQLPDGSVETIDGTVGDWKTTGTNSPWGKASNQKMMLAYRGARQWARLHAPGTMLGVYSDDEMSDLADDARARRATPVGSGLASRLAASTSAPSTQGFNAGSIDREINGDTVDADTGEVTTNAKPAATSGQATPGGAEKENETTKPQSTASKVAGPNSGQGGEEASPTPSKPAVVPPPSPDVPNNDGVSSGDRAADQDGSAVPPNGAPVSNYPYGDYARALARASQEKSLSSFDQQYRNKSGWTTNEDALPTLREIFALHRKKLRGEMTPAVFVAELTKMGAMA